MRVIIIANSPVKSFKKIYQPRDDDYIITTDAGIKETLILNRNVNLALGDFDSGGLELASRRADIVKTFKIMKDEVDLELALMEVSTINDVSEIIIYDALHGRLDHFLTNLKCIAKYTIKYHLPIFLVDEKHRITYLEKGIYHLQKMNYEHLSIINFEEADIEIAGVLYPLSKTHLSPFDTYTVSNKIIDKDCVIKVLNGAVYCLQVKEKNVNI